MAAPVRQNPDQAQAFGIQGLFPSLKGDLAPVQLLEQVLHVRGDQVDDADLEGLPGGQAGGLPHRFFRPFGIASAHLGQTTDIGGCIADGLLGHGIARGFAISAFFARF